LLDSADFLGLFPVLRLENEVPLVNTMTGGRICGGVEGTDDGSWFVGVALIRMA
jgi:hypothetical protein